MKSVATWINRVSLLLVGLVCVALLLGCSDGDEVTVTTESNTPAANGSAIIFSGTSADGTQTVNLQSDGTSTSLTRLSYSVESDMVHTFCLETETVSGIATILDINETLLLELDSDSCAEIELVAGMYLVVVHPNDTVSE